MSGICSTQREAIFWLHRAPLGLLCYREWLHYKLPPYERAQSPFGRVERIRGEHIQELSLGPKSKLEGNKTSPPLPENVDTGREIPAR